MVYRVLADGIDIYGSDTESSLLSPSLETELNSAGSLDFTLPPDHPSYDDISLMQTEIDVYEDDDLIFFGRPAEVSIDWNKQKKVVCEGALAYLNDAAIRPHKFEGALISDVFKYIIAQYNAQVAQNKQFIVGNITITDRYVYTEFDYDICLSVLISTCIDSTGGYLFLRKEEAGIYIDWLAEVPDASDQPVQFASNMLDLNQDTKAEDICTVVLPVGGQVDGVNITIAPVNQGSDILEDSDAIAKYGRILKIQQWNDIIDPQALKDKATEWLAKQQEDDITIETDAAELHYIDGSVGAYRIGQLVNVISGPHGVDKEYPILKMSMNLDSGTKRITLGTPPRKELTELSGITNSTGGGSSSGGGGGGGSTGVTDVLVNGSSVVSDHVARVSAVTAQQLADGLALKADEDDFEVLQTAVAGKANQSDLNALSTTVAGKANQSDLNALSTAVAGKQDQLTPGTGISIDANNVISATGGGGTEVEANPSEPATDDLETIKIGDTVYDIPGGSTNYGKFKCDVLFNTPTSLSGWSNPITICTKSVVEEYDVLVLTFGREHQETATILVADLLSNQNGRYYYLPTTNANGGNFHVSGLRIDSNNNLLFYVDASGDYIYKVYGLKFENKLINRSDIYSEEERMIGRWTDGKPLYQRTIVKDLTLSSSWQNYYDLIGIDLVNVEINKLMRDNEPIPLVFSNIGVGSWIKRDGYLKFCVQGSQASEGWILKSATIQYTKTTDQPGSGFLSEDPQMVMMSDYYSEDEQVVGRWTDGKPLYQRTYRNISITNNADNIIDSSFGTDKNICTHDIEFRGISGNYRSDYNNSVNDTLYSNNNGQLVYYFYKTGSWSQLFDTLDITVQYTKTTDAPGTGPTKGNLIYLPALYSEEEREVGVWTDGKPIYQKTLSITFTANTGNWTVLDNNDIYDYLVSSHGTFYEINGTNQDKVSHYDALDASPRICVRKDHKLYYFFNTYSGSNRQFKFDYTIQYTKTTDQPGSGTWTPEGQLAHHYSTSDKIVGTWIDGSTVYERTIQLTADLTTSDTAWTQVQYDNPVTNMSYLIDCKVLNTTGTYLLERFSNDNGALAAASKQSGTIFRSGTYMIIQYTKSS